MQRWMPNCPTSAALCAHEKKKPDWIKPMMLEIRITMSAVIGDDVEEVNDAVVPAGGVSSNLGFSSSRNIQSPRPMTQQAVSSVELAVGLLDVLAVRSCDCARDDKMTSTLIDDRCISHSLPHRIPQVTVVICTVLLSLITREFGVLVFHASFMLVGQQHGGNSVRWGVGTNVRPTHRTHHTPYAVHKAYHITHHIPYT